MTQNSTKRWKVILPVSIAAILLVAVAGFNLFNPNAQAVSHAIPVDGISLQCDQIEHFDKIIFINKDELLKKLPPNIGSIAVPKETIMDLKVLDTFGQFARPMDKVLEKANIVWTTEDGEDITLKDLELIDVEYAAVCVSLIEPGNAND